MIKRIVFFNHWHKGDLHVSRSFVREACIQASAEGITCQYLHNHGPRVLQDIKLGIGQRAEYALTTNTKTHVRGDTLYWNTWYAADKSLYHQHRVTFDTLYYSFAKVFKEHLGRDITQEDPWKFFPSIDYSKFDIGNTTSFIQKNHGKKKLFISNGNVLSGQIENFDFNQVIAALSRRYKDWLILATNKNNGELPKAMNIIETRSIISCADFDLNENSYLASHCDVIVGRFSGAYTFAMTTENYQNPNLKFVVFCKDHYSTWINTMDMSYQAKILGSRLTDTSGVTSFIANNL
jgi:hypothetical protein